MNYLGEFNSGCAVEDCSKADEYTIIDKITGERLATVKGLAYAAYMKSVKFHQRRHGGASNVVIVPVSDGADPLKCCDTESLTGKYDIVIAPYCHLIVNFTRGEVNSRDSGLGFNFPAVFLICGHILETRYYKNGVPTSFIGESGHLQPWIERYFCYTLLHNSCVKIYFEKLDKFGNVCEKPDTDLQQLLQPIILQMQDVA